MAATAATCAAATVYMFHTGSTPYESAIAAILTAVSIFVGMTQPVLLLVIGSFAKLCGGDYVQLSSAGSLWIVAGTVWLLFDMLLAGSKLQKNDTVSHWMSGLALALVVYLAFRALIGEEASYTSSLILSAIGTLGSLIAVHRGHSIRGPIAGVGVAFIWSSWIFGSYNTADRFAGVSGNPNVMVTGLALSLPFVMWGLRKGTRKLDILLGLSALLAVYLCFISQSTQAIVALVAILACTIIAGLSKAFASQSYSLVVLPAVIVSVFYTVWLTEVQLSEDLTTLSGRTQIFADAWAVIIANPVFGTGQTHLISAGVPRNAHSSMLSIGVLSGMLSLTLWVLLLLVVLKRSDSKLRSSQFYGAAGLVIVLIQGVQTIESDPLTWLIIVILLTPNCLQDRDRYNADELDQLKSVGGEQIAKP
ncbi:O-antigen ligase family protein [Dietzia cercidiphylli]|uniref:O-antigen ligase family protein n=1 Tax=Dietzia cercidiphylli TaxID=498199 RepID=UPI00223C2179|nr:O-antigen ligase family protein [Dietzia cercidiphylli]MCT1516950.1 O-antigen ligase family protein [Dietzia cercidiphylli]